MLGAMSLGGVEDVSMIPIRGQTILVYAPQITEQFCDIVGMTSACPHLPHVLMGRR